ncbi:zinc ribbon domain-containing protein [Kitasatospora sp. NPDC018058]|uniref:zinc ribbon domain-containing protein n=1 Tax=Kitasatospora sp. NPDC018058 TaxID=3364025 RepID=UPI0037C01DDD
MVGGGPRPRYRDRICSACRHRDGPEPLNVRRWTCLSCSTVHDRDRNAARGGRTRCRADPPGTASGPRGIRAGHSRSGGHTGDQRPARVRHPRRDWTGPVSAVNCVRPLDRPARAGRRGVVDR